MVNIVNTVNWTHSIIIGDPNLATQKKLLIISFLSSITPYQFQHKFANQVLFLQMSCYWGWIDIFLSVLIQSDRQAWFNIDQRTPNIVYKAFHHSGLQWLQRDLCGCRNFREQLSPTILHDNSAYFNFICAEIKLLIAK